VIQLAGLHPAVRERAELTLRYAALYKIPVTVTSTYRGWADQDRLRKRYERCLARGEEVQPGNANPGCRYPANEAGDSAHNWRLAFDSWVPAPYIEIWKAIRRWAGFTVPDGDTIHAEVPGWRAYTPYLPFQRG